MMEALSNEAEERDPPSGFLAELQRSWGLRACVGVCGGGVVPINVCIHCIYVCGSVYFLFSQHVRPGIGANTFLKKGVGMGLCRGGAALGHISKQSIRDRKR